MSHAHSTLRTLFGVESRSAGDGARIRVRAVTSIERGGWIWELFTPDGHVANASEVFAQRSECIADAQKQGTPLVRLKRQRRDTTSGKITAAHEAVTNPVHTCVISKTRSDLWIWKYFDGEGVQAETSAVLYLSRADCVKAARERGFLPIAGGENIERAATHARQPTPRVRPAIAYR